MIKQLYPTISVNTMAFFKKNEDYLKLNWLIKVLRNGCFHNVPVIWPRLSHNGPRKVVLARSNAEGQCNLPWAIMTNLGHITGPLWKHPFSNTIVSIQEDKRYNSLLQICRTTLKIRRKCTYELVFLFPAHNLTLTKWAPMTDFRREMTRTYKSVVIFHSVILFKSVFFFAFQAEKNYLYKEGQFLIFLPNSLLPSFALRWI